MKDWISSIWQGHVWGHIEDTFKPSNFFLFRHFYSFEHILTEEYLIFIHTINITKNQMILVMSCFVVLKRRNWFELRIYSSSDWAQCASLARPALRWRPTEQNVLLQRSPKWGPISISAAGFGQFRLRRAVSFTSEIERPDTFKNVLR